MPHIDLCCPLCGLHLLLVFFFFNDTATTEIYTLSLHDALPISPCAYSQRDRIAGRATEAHWRDRKSTRLNSSHVEISYAVFCLKKKKYRYTLKKISMLTHKNELRAIQVEAT